MKYRNPKNNFTPNSPLIPKDRAPNKAPEPIKKPNRDGAPTIKLYETHSLYKDYGRDDS